jgi:hypothetical protein
MAGDELVRRRSLLLDGELGPEEELFVPEYQMVRRLSRFFCASGGLVERAISDPINRWGMF